MHERRATARFTLVRSRSIAAIACGAVIMLSCLDLSRFPITGSAAR